MKTKELIEKIDEVAVKFMHDPEALHSKMDALVYGQLPKHVQDRLNEIKDNAQWWACG